MSREAVEHGKIAAVFDIDGTLLPAPSLELRLLARLAMTRELRLGAVASWLRSLMAQIISAPRAGKEFKSPGNLLDENKLYLAGVRAGVAEKCIASQLEELEFFSEALTMMGWHRRRGHAIILISGTLGPLARAVASLLAEGEEIIIRATELECDGHEWTGRIAGEAICGQAKEQALLELASERNFDLKRSYVYANSMRDRWLLGAVGHPIAVNPSPILARHARRLGWRIANWSERARLRQRSSCSQLSCGEKARRIYAEKSLWK
jgi:HAD superfamily phosphoserine phosphatase-like hydrolase